MIFRLATKFRRIIFMNLLFRFAHKSSKEYYLIEYRFKNNYYKSKEKIKVNLISISQLN